MFLGLIPKKINQKYRKSPKDFLRNSKLPFQKLIIFILSITTSGKDKGVDGKSGEFFKNVRRTGLWQKANAIHRSTLTKARSKVSWEIFQEIFESSVNLAYELWPNKDKYLWEGMSVIAFDGSRYVLPATNKLRAEFDPESGLENPGKGHYPQCLVTTAYDVFRRIPVARSIVSIHGSERDEAHKLLPKIPSENVLLFDRGYPGFEFINKLNNEYEGSYLFRCSVESSFKPINGFINSKQKETIITIKPPRSFLSKLKPEERKAQKEIKLRVIRLESPDGTLSVLLTNLFDKKKFNRNKIIDLYYRRWEVESYYRDEKIELEITKFHSKTSNGIQQELMAGVIMAVISRTLMVLAEKFDVGEKEYQFKNAIMTLSAEVAVLVPDNPKKAIKIFKEILVEIRRVKYYRPKKKRKPYPRITKKNRNKWIDRRNINTK